MGIDWKRFIIDVEIDLDFYNCVLVRKVKERGNLMLKIHSFLRTMKDKEKHFEKGIQYKHSKRIAIVAYVVAAILLVSYFGDFHGLHLYSMEYMVDAAAHDTMEQDSEESAITTQKEDIQLLDSSKLLDPLDQLHQQKLTIGELTKEDVQALTEDNTIKKVAITDPQEQIKQQVYDITMDPKDGEVVLFSLEESAADLAHAQASLQFEAVTALASTSAENAALEAANKAKLEAARAKEKAKEAAKKENASKKENATTASTKSDALAKTLNKKMIKNLSQDELNVLYRIVEAEATGEDVYGKILVANVILNRVNSKRFPGTVEEVVFQKSGNTYQFSPTKDGRFWSVKVTAETKEAVSRALEGEDYSNGALYFFARRLTSSNKASWFDNSLQKVLKYGCHEFYKDK